MRIELWEIIRSRPFSVGITMLWSTYHLVLHTRGPLPDPPSKQLWLLPWWIWAFGARIHSVTGISTYCGVDNQLFLVVFSQLVIEQLGSLVLVTVLAIPGLLAAHSKPSRMGVIATLVIVASSVLDLAFVLDIQTQAMLR